MNNTRNCNFILIIAPSAPPQNFTAIGGENISLTWIPPPFIDQNGVLVDYFIEYFGIERDTHTRNTTVPSSQHYSIIFGLDEYTTVPIQDPSKHSYWPRTFHSVHNCHNSSNA